MANWLRVRFRGDRVLAMCESSGTLMEQDGLVTFCYKPGGKTYRTHLHKLEVGPDAEVVVGEDPPVQTPPAPRPRSSGKAGYSGRLVEAPARPDSIQVWTDGACTGNPGPAGLGVLIRRGDGIEELSEYLGEGTNNIAELMAIFRGLEQLEDASGAVDVMTDSSYCIGLLTKGWKPKKNQELVAEVRALTSRFTDLRFVKVKGHAGVPDNERADELARLAVERRC